MNDPSAQEICANLLPPVETPSTFVNTRAELLNKQENTKQEIGALQSRIEVLERTLASIRTSLALNKDENGINLFHHNE